MHVYLLLFPWIVMTLATVAAATLIVGGALTAFWWSNLPGRTSEQRASDFYAGVWAFVGSSLAAMAVLWIAKQMLTY